MATRVYLRSVQPFAHSFGFLATRENGGGDVIWGTPLGAGTAKGAGVGSNTVTTIAGPVAGLEFTSNGTNPLHFWTPPLDRDVTISGTMTFNLWGSEDAAATNAGLRVIVEANAGRIVSSQSPNELGTSTAVDNWTAGATSTVVPKGSRLRIRVLADDAGGTMAAGSATLRTGGTTDGADGDSYIEFSEDFAFQDVDGIPSGDVLYLRDTALGSNPTSLTEHLLDLSRGSSPVDVSNTGFDSWFYKDLGHDWYTPAMTYDVTLSGLIRINLRCYYTRAFANDRAFLSCQVYVVDGDGTNPVEWTSHRANHGITMNLNTEAAYTRLVCSGPDTVVATGKRLRFYFRCAPDDIDPNSSTSTNHLVYDGATPGGSGDSYITLPFTLTEPPPPITDEAPLRQGISPLRWR